MSCYCPEQGPICERIEQDPVTRTFPEGEGEHPPYLPQPGDEEASPAQGMSSKEMGPIGPWATGRVAWDPTAGMTGVRPVVDRYSITRFSPMDWRRMNQNVIDGVINTDAISHNSKCTMQNIAAASDRQQNENTLRLQQRAQDIRRYQSEIESLVLQLREEIVLLTASKIRLKFSLPVLKMPETIAGECIEMRSCRIEPDLVRDEVEEELIKEVAMVREVRSLFDRVLDQIEVQLAANKASKEQLESDWSDKKEVGEIEAINVSLKNTSPSILYHHGATRIPADQSTPLHWENFSKEMIQNGHEQLHKSQDLRSMVDSTLLTDAVRDLSAQAEKVVTTLKRRIEETDQCRQCFERDLDYVLRQITEAESLYENLVKSLRQLDFNLKVAQTRLNNRMVRPRVENCRDETQYGLIDEVKSINEHASALRAQIAEVDANLSNLYKTRANLEYAILAKRKTLYIDQHRCLEYRNRYPDTVTLSGGLAN